MYCAFLSAIPETSPKTFIPAHASSPTSASPSQIDAGKALFERRHGLAGAQKTLGIRWEEQINRGLPSTILLKLASELLELHTSRGSPEDVVPFGRYPKSLSTPLDAHAAF